MKKILLSLALAASTAAAASYVRTDKVITLDSLQAGVPRTVEDSLIILFGQDTVVGVYTLNLTVTSLPDTVRDTAFVVPRGLLLRVEPAQP